MNFKWTSGKIIAENYIKKYHSEGDSIDESLIRALVNEHVDTIVGPNNLAISLTLIEVRDFHGFLPENHRSTLNVSARGWNRKRATRIEISEWVKKLHGTDCEVKINVECNRCEGECTCGIPIAEINVDEIFRMSNPQFQAAKSKFFHDYQSNIDYRTTNSDYKDDQGFYRVWPSTNNYFGINYYLGDCIGDPRDKRLEYRVEDSTIITNFQQGQLLVSYLGYKFDPEGYKMIPNVSSVINALSAYIASTLMRKKFIGQIDERTRLAWQLLSAETDKLTRDARSEVKFPEMDEFVSKIQTYWKYSPNPTYWFQHGSYIPDHYDPTRDLRK